MGEMIMTKANLDSQNKALEILKERCLSTEMDISSNGVYYSLYKLSSRYTVSGVIEEKMHGVSSINPCYDLLKEAEDNWPAVLERLNMIQSSILSESTSRSGMIINLTGDKKVLELTDQEVEGFLKKLPGNSEETLPDFYSTVHPWVDDALAEMKEYFPTVDEAIITSTQVNFVGQGGDLYGKGEELDGSVLVVTDYLTYNFLWNEIRVLSGAYGAGSYLSDGVHFFYSYRDPNFIDTMKVYDQTPEFLDEAAENLKQNPKKLELAIISTIGGLDGGPLSSEQQGWTSFKRWLNGESAAARQKRRNDILSTSPEAFEEFSQRLKQSTRASVCVVSSMSAYEEALNHQDEVGRNISMVLLE